MKNRQLTARELQSLNADRCPMCGGHGFIAGPKGGASQNIECANDVCRARFNAARSPRYWMAWEIDKEGEGGANWHGLHDHRTRQ